MEPYFADQCRTLTEKIRALREPDNLCFALLAGTAVSDFADHTDENIRAVDAQTHFDGVIHLGDILNGSIPENASRFVLSQELARFQNATASGKLYIACGDDDGYRNERYVGQIVTGIVTDERWYQETAYLEQYPDLHRPQNKPYYYVDFSERKARLIFLSSYVSQIDEQEELFEKAVNTAWSSLRGSRQRRSSFLRDGRYSCFRTRCQSRVLKRVLTHGTIWNTPLSRP